MPLTSSKVAEKALNNLCNGLSSYISYTLRLPYYNVLDSIGTSPSSITAITIIVGTRPRYNTNRLAELPLGWQRHVNPDNEILPVGNNNENLLQAFPAVILSIRSRDAFNMTIF